MQYTEDYARAYRDVKRLYTSGQKILDRMSEAWLAYQFGVVPLMSDVQGIMDNYHELANRRAYKRVRARMSSREVTSEVVKSNFDACYSRSTCIVKTTETYYNGGAVFEVQNQSPTFDHFLDNRNWGLRIEDFVPTLYELFPFSFVVDYFSNLNEVVNAQFVNKSSLVFAWVGGKKSITQESNSSYTWSLPYPPIVSKPPHGHDATWVNSVVGRSDVINDLSNLNLRWDDFPSVKQAVNLSALANLLNPFRK
jgi:hypothetical protein